MDTPVVDKLLSGRVSFFTSSREEEVNKTNKQKQLERLRIHSESDTLFSFRLQILSTTMTTSRRLADRKVERFEKNIKKRGAVPETTTKKGTSYPVGPVVLGFFIFVVIGSSLFQIIRTATSGGMA
uniref:Putative stress-associated endoplasmic reticulum protein 2-like n=1 Tax=Davidia involucrata TaxID=16924 RepID=A0A5B6ZS09_DAVIN